MIKNRKKVHYAFLLFLLLQLTACVTRPVRSGRSGLFENNSRDPGKPTSAMYGEDRTEEIRLTGRWQWPLKNVDVSSHYGNRKNKFHQGVDFRANVGTPVLAANDGVVVYVGSKIRGYGRMIVLKHEDNFYSVYAHHSKNLVKIGKRVSRGEKIALSGRSGRASGPHLHFEIRQGTDSYNPYYAINENLKRYASNRSIASESTQ